MKYRMEMVAMVGNRITFSVPNPDALRRPRPQEWEMDRADWFAIGRPLDIEIAVEPYA